MRPLIPFHLQVEYGVPVFQPEPGIYYRGPPLGETTTDEEFNARWGREWVPNLAIMRPGESILFPGLTPSVAPKTWNRINGYARRYGSGFISRQQPEGIRVWRIK